MLPLPTRCPIGGKMLNLLLILCLCTGRLWAQDGVMPVTPSGKMPRLSGTSLSRAKSKLPNVGEVKVLYQLSDLAPGTVVRTHPGVGATLFGTSRVILFVSQPGAKPLQSLQSSPRQANVAGRPVGVFLVFQMVALLLLAYYLRMKRGEVGSSNA